VQKLQKLITIW